MPVQYSIYNIYIFLYFCLITVDLSYVVICLPITVNIIIII